MYYKNTSSKWRYLDENFKFFHLNDRTNEEFRFHYHDFNKIIIFLSGNVTYLIEGKSYKLEPWDILIVNNHDVHKAIINPNENYERIILWANEDFIKLNSQIDCDLLTCFKLVSKNRFNLIRLSEDFLRELKLITFNLENSLISNEFGSKLLSNSLFIQLIIYLNRIYLGKMYITSENSLKYDKQIEKILKYINSHISEPLSIEFLSEKFYMSKYYFMHKFKTETGYTVHNYILQKRLFIAKDLIKEGMPITKAAIQCGFNDYSNFLRSFKKVFNKSPRDFIK